MPISTTTKPNRRKRELLETTKFSGAEPSPCAPESVQDGRKEKRTPSSQADVPELKYGDNLDSRIGHNRGPPLHQIEPLAVPPRVAWHLLGCGRGMISGADIGAVRPLRDFQSEGFT